MPPQIQEITRITLFFLPVQTRVPLKFGAETLTSVTCARVAMEVVDAAGNRATGWGETPLSVQASDPEGDALEFAWASSCAGTFSGGTCSVSCHGSETW